MTVRGKSREEHRASLLVLSQSLPYPPHAGVTRRTFNILRELAVAFDVTLVAFSRRRHQPSPGAREEAERRLQDIPIRVRKSVPIRSEWSKIRLAWDHSRSLITGRPYTYHLFENRGFAQQLRESLAAETPDLIHLDSLDLHGWLPYLPRVPVTCTHHSIESGLLALRATRTSPHPLAAYVRRQARLIERLERRLSPGFAANLMMSEIDSRRLLAIAPRARTFVVPNGVDTEFFSPSYGREVVSGRLAFLGPSYMLPNRDAVEFFLEQIWPRVRAACPHASLHLIGSCPDEDKRRFERANGVVSLGYVEDIRPHMAEAACSIVPLRVGGGTRLKILDAWAMGKAVVSTSVGCEGLHTVDGENIMIRNDPAEFAEAVVAVLRDVDLRRRLETSARATAEQHYSWAQIGESLRDLYARIITST
jgi:glycosyltransferase involved in cell wall biosynthesis